MLTLWEQFEKLLGARVSILALSFVGVVGVWITLGAHFALAEGHIPALHPGYCRLDQGCPVVQTISQEIEKIQATLAGMERSRLRGEIRVNFRLQCATEVLDEKLRLQEYIEIYQEEYALINNGNRYPLPPVCQS